MEKMVTMSPFGGVYKNKRVLITGHTGFKGSWLAIWLKMLGAEVRGYALEPPSDPSNFEACGLQDKLIHIHGDVRDHKHLLSVFQEYQPEFIFHLAAQPLVRFSYEEPRTTYETNVMGTVNVLEAARVTNSARVIINITSDKCYENKEWVWGYRENDPMGGYDPYSSSKGCAELLTAAYRASFFNPNRYEAHKVSLSSVRAGNVIGGGDWGQDRLIPDCIRAVSQDKPILIRNPDATRPWQHVLEPLHGYLLLAVFMYHSGPRYAGAWNFGPLNAEVLTVEEVVNKFIHYWGSGSSTIPASLNASNSHPPHEANWLKLDCSKAHTLLHWKPRYSIDQALKETIEWFKVYYKGGGKEEMHKKTRVQIMNYQDSLEYFNRGNDSTMTNTDAKGSAKV